MLYKFYQHIRQFGVPASPREYLDLMRGLEHHVAFADPTEFYHLARATLCKDERVFDRFDRAFRVFFEGIQNVDDMLAMMVPEDWLRAQIRKSFTDEELDKLGKAGGIDELMKEFQERLAEQKKRHEGGTKMVGTGGASPFGHSGAAREGVRVGGEGEHGQAAKVWERREYRNLDADETLGPRSMKLALRRLRRLAHEGVHEEFDLDGTIRATAKNAGHLDVHMRRERRNATKLLVLFDIGGSMDPHVRTCEALFNAARSEFSHLEYYYFHNCPYDMLWKDNGRRYADRKETFDIINTYGAGWKLLFVGDASMAPYELGSVGGSLEHFNEVPGIVWVAKLVQAFGASAWLNPIPEADWGSAQSINLVQTAMHGRMFPMSLDGLDRCTHELARL